MREVRLVCDDFTFGVRTWSLFSLHDGFAQILDLVRDVLYHFRCILLRFLCGGGPSEISLGLKCNYCVVF